MLSYGSAVRSWLHNQQPYPNPVAYQQQNALPGYHATPVFIPIAVPVPVAVTTPARAVTPTEEIPLTNNPFSSSSKKVRSKYTKWSHEKWRRNLRDYYYLVSSESTHMSINKYMRDVVKEESVRANFNRVWNLLNLGEYAKDKVSYNDPRIQDALDKMFPDEALTQRLCTRNSNSIFTHHKEKLATELLVQLAEAGHPMSRPNFVALLRDILNEDSESDLSISATTAARIYQDATINSHNKTSSLDPARALQANPKVLEAFFKDLDAMIQVLHRINPDIWPDRFANLPPSHQYNTDEQGPNPTKLAHSVLIPDHLKEVCKRTWRTTPEGDGRMGMHYTATNNVCANGARCIPAKGCEGAPPPYMIISDPTATDELDEMGGRERDLALFEQTTDDVIEVSDAILQGWFDDYDPEKTDNFVNPYGFQIRTTPSGSMLRRTFFHFINHFIANLPHDQGPGGKGVVLTCDWHSSRACPKSMMYALEKNVYIHVLPSKTSIWSQPCDNGENEAVQVSIAHVAESHGLLATNAMTYHDANKVFREGLETHADTQLDKLRRTNQNAAKSSFEKTGLYPFSYSNESWDEATKTLGKVVRLIEDAKTRNGAEIVEKYWIAALKSEEEIEDVSDDEKKMLQEYGVSTKKWPYQDLHYYLKARLVGEDMIKNYLEDANRDKSQPPQPKTDVERITCKLFEFVPADERVNTVSTLTREEVQDDESRTHLAITEIGKSVLLTKKTDRSKTYDAIKQSAEAFIVINPEKKDIISIATRDISAEYIVTRHEQPLQTADRKKNRKRELADRKKRITDMKAKAEAIAEENRRLYLVAHFNECLNQYNQGQYSDDDLFREMQAMFEQGFDEEITVNKGKLTETFNITMCGFNTCAISSGMRNVIVAALTKRQSIDSQGPRKRRKRQPISTKLGHSGLTAGMKQFRHRMEEEMEENLKGEKKARKDLKIANDLLEGIKGDVAANESGYWVVDQMLTGKRRERMAKLCQVYRSVDTAKQQSEKLTALHLTKEIVDNKIDELEDLVDEKMCEVTTAEFLREKNEALLAKTDQYKDTINANENCNLP